MISDQAGVDDEENDDEFSENGDVIPRKDKLNGDMDDSSDEEDDDDDEEAAREVFSARRQLSARTF